MGVLHADSSFFPHRLHGFTRISFLFGTQISLMTQILSDDNYDNYDNFILHTWIIVVKKSAESAESAWQKKEKNLCEHRQIPKWNRAKFPNGYGKIWLIHLISIYFSKSYRLVFSHRLHGFTRIFLFSLLSRRFRWWRRFFYYYNFEILAYTHE